MQLRVSLVLCALVVGGCQCGLDDNRVDRLEDAGFTEPDAGPPPPVFPLKEGDELEFQLGGRIPDDTARCPNGVAPGDCERDIKATYIITDTQFDDNRWKVKADFFYEGTKDVVEASVISQLVLENGAPFSQVSTGTPVNSDNPATFSTDVPATQDLTANGFPFFQYESGEAAIFEGAGQAFCDAWREVDDEAECDVRPGDHRMEAYFFDSAAENKLHELRVEYHPMGFICDWKETLATVPPGTPRNASGFAGIDGDPVAFFLTPIRVRRDGESYTCFCSTQVCKSQSDPTKCLDPSDPDAVVTCPGL